MKLLVCLLLFIGFMGIVSADITINYTLIPKNFKPGTSGSALVVITNIGISQITGIRVQPAGYGFRFEHNIISAGDLGPGGSTAVSIPFKIMDEAKAGVYTLQIGIYWTEVDTHYKFFSIPVPVSDFPELSITSPEELRTFPGANFSFKINIKNTGGKALEVVLSPNSTYFLPSTSKILIGNIDKGENASVQLSFTSLTSVPSGLYSIPIMLAYHDELGNELQTTLFIKVRVELAEPKLNVNISTAPAEPGESFEVKIKIKNIGKAEAKKVNVFISANHSFVLLGSSNYYIEKLGVGEETDIMVKFTSDENAELKPYIIPIHVVYSDENDVKYKLDDSIGIELKGSAKLDIAKKLTEPSIVVEGEAFTLTIKIENTGTDDAEGVKVKIVGFEGDTKAYLGKIERNDYGNAIFTLKAGEAGKRNVSLTIEWEGGEIKRDINIIVEPAPQQNYIALIVLGIVIVGVIVWRVWKR